MRAVLLSGKVYVKGIDGDLTSKQIDAPELPSSKSKGKSKKSATAGATPLMQRILQQ